jgi:hypothetical protein
MNLSRCELCGETFSVSQLRYVTVPEDEPTPYPSDDRHVNGRVYACQVCRSTVKRITADV